MERYSWNEYNYILTGIEQVRDEGRRTLGYHLSRNARIIRQEMEDIESTYPELTEEQQEELREVQEKQRKLIRKYADKPVPNRIRNVSALFENDLNQKAYFEALEKVQAEHEELQVAIEERERKIQDIRTERTGEPEFKKFNFKYIPEEWGHQQIDPLYPLIDEQTFEEDSLESEAVISEPEAETVSSDA